MDPFLLLCPAVLWRGGGGSGSTHRVCKPNCFHWSTPANLHSVALGPPSLPHPQPPSLSSKPQCMIDVPPVLWASAFFFFLVLCHLPSAAQALTVSGLISISPLIFWVLLYFVLHISLPPPFSSSFPHPSLSAFLHLPLLPPFISSFCGLAGRRDCSVGFS